MKKVGIATTSVMVIAAAGALVLGVVSIPDVKRYLKIRSM